MADENNTNMDDGVKEASEWSQYMRRAQERWEDDSKKFLGNLAAQVGTIATGVAALTTKQGREFTRDAYKSGIVQTKGYSDEEYLAISDIVDAIADANSMKDLLLDGIFAVGNQMVNQLSMEAELRRAINEETGLTGELAEDLRNEIWEAYPGILNMGYGIEEITKYYTELIEQTGKFTLLNSQVLEKSAQVSRAFVGDLSEMSNVISNFEKVGIGATNTLETVEDVGIQMLSLGLRSKTIIKEIGENIELVNQYGFQDGIEGLANMIKKSKEFRMNMQDTFTIAEKVISPEGAIDLAAQLQVIGGTIGDFADPLKMMYMATNNVEGLQDALIGAADTLATYNSEQGKFEVSGANLRRARDMADAMGISLNDLTRTAVAASERSKAAMDLLSTGLQMDDEDREFLTNLGTMKDGVMTIQVPESISEKLSLPTEIAVNQLTSDIAGALLDNKDAFAEMDSRDIAMEQLTELTKMERNIAAMAALTKVQASRMLKESEIYKGGEAILTQENQNLLNAWSGGQFEQMVEGALSMESPQGKAFLGAAKDVYGNMTEALKIGMKELGEKFKIERQEASKPQQQNSNVNMHVTVSSSNNQERLMKGVMKEAEKVGLNKNKRSFVSSDFFW